jgi:hypothetical protein
MARTYSPASDATPHFELNCGQRQAFEPVDGAIVFRSFAGERVERSGRCRGDAKGDARDDDGAMTRR